MCCVGVCLWVWVCVGGGGGVYDVLTWRQTLPDRYRADCNASLNGSIGIYGTIWVGNPKCLQLTGVNPCTALCMGRLSWKRCCWRSAADQSSLSPCSIHSRWYGAALNSMHRREFHGKMVSRHLHFPHNQLKLYWWLGLTSRFIDRVRFKAVHMDRCCCAYWDLADTEGTCRTISGDPADEISTFVLPPCGHNEALPS